ncbi:very short patch repair endonuclease [Catelliglobosispora koreensis]|uniref:very short patch repair endonuclease n=1 Tax=Catelliglobosispora koreensis TaxID=129052 RepID=UPI000475C902|nr:very short patch repair endonuclease [Catelliglobosispora koreensis]
MRANKGRDTRPELRLRRAVHALGLRYRVGIRPISTIRRTADLVFARSQVAVFLDGCFWHGCAEHHRPARVNAQFWAEKLAQTRLRDAATDERLRETGWHVIRIWEHENLEDAALRVREAVLARRPASRQPMS